MARELVIHTWCDLCLRGDGRSESARSLTLTVGGGKPAQLDLCDVHYVSVQDAVEAFEAFGHPPDADGPAAAQPKLKLTRDRSPNGQPKTSLPADSPQLVDLRCKVCPHLSSTANAMWQHARQVHGMMRNDYREAEVVPGSAFAGPASDLLSA